MKFKNTLDIDNNNIENTKGLGFQDGQSLTWNTKYHTINVPTGDGSITKIGLDTMFDIHNATGVPLLKGQVVYPDGTSTGGVSNVQLCLANTHETINTLIGIIPFDIPNGSDGHVMVQGVIDPIDTSGLSAGPVYLSSTVPGGLTSVSPEFPNYNVIVGVVDAVGVSGVVTIDTAYNVENTVTQAWDGSFRESIDCLISSNGTTITASLERTGGGDLTMMFSDGFTMLDCTPAQTIALTPGTDTIPQANYIYISKATKALVVSTSGFPSDEHIKVSDVAVQSATGTQINGALVNRNWNDHVKAVGDNGHLLHIAERLRQNHAEWEAGVLGSCTVSAPTLSNVYVATTGGQVYQLHKQNFPIFDTATGDDLHIVNHPTTPYTTISNLNTQTVDSLGVSLANYSFSFVLWGVQNKSQTNCHLMINLPKGSYAKNAPEDAIADAFNYSVYDIPKNFKGKGFLIARFTFILEPNGTSWTLYDTEDLRGKVPNSAAGASGGGGGGAGVTEFDALTDTPSTKVGQALKLLRVGASETAIEYETIENILPSNIAKTDVNNNFSVDQTIVGNITATNLSGTNTGDQDISGIVTNATNLSNHISNHPAPTNRDIRNQIAGTYSTDIHANITALDNVSGTNTGDNAVNSLYSGLVSNVSTNLSTTHNASTVVINSSDGTNATINAANATTAGIMSEAIYDQHVLNNAKISFDSTSSTRLANTSGTNTGDNAVNSLYSGLISNATHTGEVTGSTALTIIDGAITIAKLSDELSGIATLPTGNNVIDFKANIHYDKTLDAAWSPTFTNPVKGKSIVILATGNNAAYTLTMPSYVKGDISGWDGTMTNQLTLYCVDDSTTEGVYSLTLLNW